MKATGKNKKFPFCAVSEKSWDKALNKARSEIKLKIVGICHDCGCKEGEIHELGCDMEKCPFCGEQLIMCDCYYHIFGVEPSKETDNDEKRWIEILEGKGRIPPYIHYPYICRRCGKLYPAMFNVPDEEWERYIQPNIGDEVICKFCYDYIKDVIHKNEKKRKK